MSTLKFMITSGSFRWRAAVNTAVIIGFAIGGLQAACQSISVVPVNVLLAPGQTTATLTVKNQSDQETAIQIRPYLWSQPDGQDQLKPTLAVIISPPIAMIPAGGSQLVRLLLKQPPTDKEATYRILLDQLPPPAQPGTVHVVFRLSIPIFARPVARVLAHVQFHVEYEGGQLYLVGRNDGTRHEAVREISLLTSGGRSLKAESGSSPYILAGVTRRWHITAPDFVPLANETFKLTSRMDSGPIEEQIHVIPKP